MEKLHPLIKIFYSGDHLKVCAQEGNTGKCQ